MEGYVEGVVFATEHIVVFKISADCVHCDKGSVVVTAEVSEDYLLRSAFDEVLT